MTVVLTMSAPCEALNSNQRLHHMVKAKRTAAWREAAYLAAQGWNPLPDGAHVRVLCHFPDNRRRDAGNWYPTAKAVLDGIVSAGVLPDDNDRYVTGPDMRRGMNATGGFALTVVMDPDCRCHDCLNRYQGTAA